VVQGRLHKLFYLNSVLSKLTKGLNLQEGTISNEICLYIQTSKIILSDKKNVKAAQK
jgi:hypothetical protein